MKKLIPLLVLLNISACSGVVYTVDSPHYMMPVGSQLRIKQNITIPENRATVYLQNGKIVTMSKLNQYHPHCWFESWQKLEQSQLIKPDIFNINAVLQYDEVVLREGRLLLASNSMARLYGRGGPAFSQYINEYRISSAKQPDIRKLYCGQWDDVSGGDHPTLAEMNKALGEYAELIPKTTQPVTPGKIGS